MLILSNTNRCQLFFQSYHQDVMDTSQKVRLNYYNFDEGGKGEEFQYVFDITPCFSPEHMFDFRVAFPVDTSTVETDNNIKDLVQQVRQEIQIAAQITPIRVQNVMVDFTKDHMYAIATLVDFPMNVPGLNM